jgi:hypothetical protein
MQNAPRDCHTEDDPNSYQTLYRAPVVGVSGMDPALSMTPCSRRCSWFPRFRTRLGQCASLEDIETLLKVKVRRWRGSSSSGMEDAEVIDDDAGLKERSLRLLDDDEVSDGYGTPMLENRLTKVSD